jgi:hypothetical protein
LPAYCPGKVPKSVGPAACAEVTPSIDMAANIIVFVKVFIAVLLVDWVDRVRSMREEKAGTVPNTAQRLVPAEVKSD